MDLLSLGKEPISPDQPAGMDARYDPVFEQLQAEIDKLTSPAAAGGMDWGKVVKLSSEILAQKSKDLLVTGYLAVGLIYTQKSDGWITGIQIYRDLLEIFWENLFPSKNRMRARSGAIEWWVEKSEIALQQLKQGPLAEENLKALGANLGKIDQLLRQNIEEPPSVSPIYRFVEEIAEFSKEQAKSETPPERAKEESKPPAAPKAQEPRKEEIIEKVSSPQDAQRVLNFGLQKIRETAVYLRQENLSDPKAYRLTRMALWSQIDNLPPATNGHTRIPPPLPQVKTTLSDLRNKGNYEALLRSAEEKLPQFVLWIDLNRLVTEAMASLGEAYQRAQEAVCQETAFLVHRLQGIENLAFSDGTPLADGDTKQWLKEIGFHAGMLVSDPRSASASTGLAQEEDQIGKEVEEAQGLIKKGKLLEGVERLQQRMRNGSSQKERLLWRLALSQLLVGNKQSKLILPCLDEIIRDVDTYRLEEYDPPLALKALRVAWLGWSSQPDQASKEKAGSVLNRIAKLDLGEVIRLGKT